MTELIVALDAPYERSLSLYDALRGAGVRWFKVGVPLLLQEGGRGLAEEIAKRGDRLMLDAKLYDTRDTVLRAVDAAVALGAAMLTVHEDCVFNLDGEDRLKILAVGGLTDGSPLRAFASTGYVAGIVCSVQHARYIRASALDKLLVCPGIRTDTQPSDNHTMPSRPSEAVDAGADYIVVGRPIIASPDPVEAAKNILRELAGAPE